MAHAPNPCGLNGFSFLEFSGPDKLRLQQQFIEMGFQLAATHKTQEIYLYQQGTIHFIVNASHDSQAAHHALTHGPGACAMGFEVENTQQAYSYALQQGAEPFIDCNHASHDLLGIKGIGGSIIYFSDLKNKVFASHWDYHPIDHNKGNGLLAIDHLTHNVFRGNMDKWVHFYESIFNFKPIRYFDIKGKMTGLISKALGSPCGTIKIPLNESKDDLSQIEEFLREYHGEGIQHIALSTGDIYHSIHTLRQQGVIFLDVPDTYYDMVQTRVPWQQESLDQLKQEKILIDGEQDPQCGLLLQLFTETVFGPVFFEIIQRKGNEGFGEGNFQALFEAIERDQIKRGTLKE